MSDSKAVQPFRGFGSARRVCVAGQVRFGRSAEPRRYRQSDHRARLWHRIAGALRLAISARVPGARVRIRCAGAVCEVKADRHGYFDACLALPPQEIVPLWRDYRVELLEPAGGEVVAGKGEVLCATRTARRVIVSDIDDTIIATGVSNKLKMLWRLFAHGAAERVPFPGIAALYRGLHAGSGTERNPMIYVSRSPWSIYPVLEEFFQLHDIPVGPVLALRDWGITLRHPFPRRARGHKRQVLERVLSVYPDLPLVLIGDSGQRDPELYTATVRRHPGRVAAIYVRDLGAGRRRRTALGVMQAEMAHLGVPMLIIESSEALAADAARRGWILPVDFEQVRDRSARELA